MNNLQTKINEPASNSDTNCELCGETNIDLFGNPIDIKFELRGKYIEPPFSILDTKSGNWQSRKRRWKELGIESELGREDELTYKGNVASFDYYRVKEGKRAETDTQSTSIFDPVLCEIIYFWFCPAGGEILDPFAGGSVRGIVANTKGYKYTGIDLSEMQIKSNIKQGAEILAANCPKYYCGDSEAVIDTLANKYDFIFSCPPYHDLEVYSNDKNDLSNMSYELFLEKYNKIISKSVARLKENRFAAFVVGEIRDNNGVYKNLVGETIAAFKRAGTYYYNEIILLNVVGSASMRADKQFAAGRKNVKIHQNVLVFYKGDPRKIKLIEFEAA